MLVTELVVGGGVYYPSSSSTSLTLDMQFSSSSPSAGSGTSIEELQHQ